MLEVSLTPRFQRMYRKLEPALQEEAREKILLFKNPDSHQQLKVHKLKGRLKNRYSFSVNYKVRIVFVYESKHAVILLAIGSHNVYK
jgi:mRNA-degrading endonuclease YafQ of YafQ-DinJ toxin-antitoxin module